jgi:hypothetical protein
MTDSELAWPALLALGAGHGINPAMGWLFAVALGLQHESRRAVWSALGPLTVGHGLAIAAAVSAMMLVGLVLPLDVLRWATAGLLVGLGLYRLVGYRHPVIGRMRMGGVELTIWSFLMASAHGAGLMVMPLAMSSQSSGPTLHHMAALPLAPGLEWSIWATLVHTVGYLMVTAVLAVVVYEKVGVRFLRKAWVNLDLVWGGALVVAGLATVSL